MALDGVTPVAPINGGGTSGIVDVGLNSPVGVNNGGTGGTTPTVARNNLFNFAPATNAVGDVFFRSSATVINRLAIGSPGEVLMVSAGHLPYWGTIAVGGGINGGTF